MSAKYSNYPIINEQAGQDRLLEKSLFDSGAGSFLRKSF